MKIIQTLDDDLGMTFNHRRQSRDSKLIQRILELVQNNKIWMNNYTKQLFPEQENIQVDENFLEKAEQDDYCIMENVEIQPYESQIQELILYFWNRKYPSDQKFTLNLENYKQTKEEEFEGNSHEKITQKNYIRRNTKWEEKNIKPKRRLTNKTHPYYR